MSIPPLLKGVGSPTPSKSVTHFVFNYLYSLYEWNERRVATWRHCSWRWWCPDKMPLGQNATMTKCLGKNRYWDKMPQTSEIEWKTKDILDDDLFLYFFLNILFLVMCYIFIWTGKESFVLSSSVFLRFVFVCIDINNTRLWHFVRDSALIRHFSAVMTHVVFGGMHCRLCAPCGACAVSARNKCHPLPNKRANISSTIRLWPYYCRLFVTDQDNYDEESRTEAVASRHWWCWHCPNSISAASHTRHQLSFWQISAASNTTSNFRCCRLHSATVRVTISLWDKQTNKQTHLVSIDRHCKNRPYYFNVAFNKTN